MVALMRKPGEVSSPAITAMVLNCVPGTSALRNSVTFRCWNMLPHAVVEMLMAAIPATATQEERKRSKKSDLFDTIPNLAVETESSRRANRPHRDMLGHAYTLPNR